MKFDKYLIKIKNGFSVNFSSMNTAAKAVGITRNDLLNVFSVTVDEDNKGKHSFEVKEQPIFERWLTDFNEPEKFTSRDQAAKSSSRSHGKKVSATLMHIQSGYNSPQTILIDKSGSISPIRSPAKELIIIENEEVFNNIELAGAFLKTASIDIATMDVLLGSGNRAANTYLQHLYRQYEKVNCFFDLEYGAMQTASSIINMLPLGTCHFVIPEHVTGFIESHGKALPIKHYEPLKKLAIKHTELSVAIQAMLRTRKRLEQEAYL